MNPNTWKITAKSSGVEWVVTLSAGSESHAVVVRAHDDGLSKSQQHYRVVAYIVGLLKTGWQPSNHKGELTLPAIQTGEQNDSSSN